MSNDYKLLVGLGNPGPTYIYTRHNVGFLFIDYCVMSINQNLDYANKFDSEITQLNYLNNKIIFAKPQTFMNLSGNAVQKIMSYYKITPNNLFVIHDDIDLPLHKVKYKFSGGAGGHNGLRSIDEKIGNKYNRVRVGVGKSDDVSSYVLSKFPQQDLNFMVDNVFNKIYSNLELLFTNPDQFNSKIQ